VTVNESYLGGGSRPLASAQQTGAVSTNLFGTSVTGLTAGRTLLAKGDDLVNQTDKVMLVDELRFDVSGSDPGYAVTGPMSGIPISVRLSVGRFLVIPRLTPLPLLCKPQDRIAVQASTPLPVGNTFEQEIGSYVWRLKKPLVLRQNDYLQLALGYEIPFSGYSDGGQSYNVTVTGVGRTVKDLPLQMYVPFVAAYLPAMQSTAFATQQNLESIASDLMNPNDEPLIVDYLLGQGVVVGGVAADTQQSVSDGSSAGLGMIATQIQIIAAGLNDSEQYSNFGVRDFQPFLHVFPGFSRAWNFKALLQPRSFLQVREQLTNWTAFAGSATQARFGIGMVGYYKVTQRMAAQYGMHLPFGYGG
jgi:hypothetical protein